MNNFFRLAKKHIPLHNFVKVQGIDVKLVSLVSEVNQRVSAKFGGNWPIGGAINRETWSDMKIDQIRLKFGEHVVVSLPTPDLNLCDVWSKWALLVTTHTFSLSHFQCWSHDNYDTAVETSACVPMLAPNPSAFGVDFCGLRETRGPGRAGRLGPLS